MGGAPRRRLQEIDLFGDNDDNDDGAHGARPDGAPDVATEPASTIVDVSSGDEKQTEDVPPPALSCDAPPPASAEPKGHTDDVVPASQPRDDASATQAPKKRSTGDSAGDSVSPTDAVGDSVSPVDVAEAKHHIIDPLAEKFLTRAAQDSAMGVTGKGRKPKPKGEPKKKSRNEASGSSGAEPKPEPKKRGRKPKKDQEEDEEHDPVRRRLFYDDDGHDGKQPEKSTSPGKKSKKRSNKTKEQQNSPLSTKAVRKAAKKSKTFATPCKKPASNGRKAKAKAKAAAHPHTEPPAPERAAAVAAPARVKRAKHKLPAFTHSSVVPYWSRNAVALKVPAGESKSGLTQARYCNELYMIVQICPGNLCKHMHAARV